MGTLKGFAPPFGPPPTTPTPLASLGLAIPSRDGARPAEPAGSPRDWSDEPGGLDVTQMVLGFGPISGPGLRLRPRRGSRLRIPAPRADFAAVIEFVQAMHGSPG